MRRFSAIIFLLCSFALAMSAQHIQRNYHDRSMSDVLIDLDKASKHYKISFIYNELEDFTVTQNVMTANIPDAIRKVIGFYPAMRISSCRAYDQRAEYPDGFLLFFVFHKSVDKCTENPNNNFLISL